ncbi:GNAT family N-acetyltransferase [Paenisporosarcina indica]|uniref:GNAT family N-acetyltransferase n=1 Tax=Paenisporosarcina indica TaxID=650093 RepID=UPI0009FE23E7|nr:GNAT family N-acetyltransferase [Paenisporosarcina indica]
MEWQSMFHYHKWATQKLLNHVGSKDRSLFHQEAKNSFKTISETYGHVITVDDLWFKRLKGIEKPDLVDFDVRSVLSTKEAFARLHTDMEAYLETLTKAAWKETLHFTNMKGHPFSNTREEMFFTFINHSSYHRGQVTSFLRQFDLDGIPVDYIYFSRDTKIDTPHLSEVTIRPFEAGDLGYVGHLHGTLYDKTYGFGPMFEYYVMKGLTEFMIDNDGGELWVAEVNGKVVGSIAITKSTDTEAQLRWFVLDEEFHGRGIGKKLMETALNFCAEQNYQHVFLWTVNILEVARHLYSKYNFTLTEEKPNDEWTGTTLLEERWDLDLAVDK